MPRPRLQRLLVEFGDKMSDIRAVGGFWQLLGGQHAPESCLGVNSVKVFWRKKTVYTAYTRGRDGKKGRNGVKGQAQIERDLNRRIDELMQRQQAMPALSKPRPPAATADLETLRRNQIEILKRLDALEKRIER